MLERSDELEVEEIRKSRIDAKKRNYTEMVKKGKSSNIDDELNNQVSALS